MAEAASGLPAADLLPVGPRANLPYRLVRAFSVPILRLLFTFDVSGRENIPRSGNYIAIANHLNWLDEFTLLWLLPTEPRLHFLADPTVLVTRRFQWWMVRTTGGYVPVVRERRGDLTLFRHVDRCLDKGGAIAIFPEANYGPKEGELLPFKKGFAHFAIKANVPVVPVALSGTKDLWFRKRIKAVVGTPLSPAGQDPAALTEQAYQEMRSILPAYSEPQGRKLFRSRLTHLF